MGGTRFQDFPSTIVIEGCDNENNTISNPNEAAWKTTRVNESPSRGTQRITIGSFTYSNPYCKLLKYSVSGTDASQITISNSYFNYKTNF